MKKNLFFSLLILIVISNTGFSQITIWDLGTGNNNLSIGAGANAGRSVSSFGGTGAVSPSSEWWASINHLYIVATGWQSGANTKGYKILVQTSAFQNIKAAFWLTADNMNGTDFGPRDFLFQYSLDNSAWTTITGGTFSCGEWWDEAGHKTNLSLPAACNNQSNVYLRWIMSSNTAVGGGTVSSTGRLKIGHISITGAELPVAPTNITLSNNSLNSYSPVNTVVGNLSAVDQNSGNSFTYSLTTGSGDTHNGSFTISGNQLKVNALLSPGTYSVRINVNDGTFNYSKSFSVQILNQAPTDILLSNSSISQSSPVGTTVGTLTAVDANSANDTFTFTLVAGEGSTHNGSFAIDGTTLKTNALLATGSYSVRINVSDGYANFAKSFTVQATNQAPTDITLTNDQIAPDLAGNTLVGTLSATDVDNSSHTFSLVSGDGDTDNGSFSITGNQLRTSGVLAARGYYIRINANDGTSNFAKQIIISVGYGVFISASPEYFYISNVSIGTVNKNSTYDADGYFDYTDQIINVQQGSTYSLSVTLGPDGESGLLTYDVPAFLKVKLFADWNHNFSFSDPGEGYDIATSVSALSLSHNITVPADALTGAARLRIIFWYDYFSLDGSQTPPSYGQSDYGEAEDYTINVTAALPVELLSFTANAVESGVSICWTTATEVNNYGFEVERSSIPHSALYTPHFPQWEKIGFVAGHGNSNSPHEYSFSDANPPAGAMLYRLKQVDNDGSYKYYDAVQVTVGAPKEFKLLQNSPNPFNPSTAIKFQLPENKFVTIKVYNQLGREVATLINEERAAGSHIAYWNGSDSNGLTVSSGVYLYKLTAGSYSETRKMNFMK